MRGKFHLLKSRCFITVLLSKCHSNSFEISKVMPTYKLLLATILIQGFQMKKQTQGDTLTPLTVYQT